MLQLPQNPGGSPQANLFGELPIPSDAKRTTAIYPNRRADKRKVEGLLGLAEHGDDTTLIVTRHGTPLSRGYVRVVYGDHGPYLELRPDQLCCHLHRKFDHPASAESYLEWLAVDDASDTRVFEQTREPDKVLDPAGGYVGHRPKEFADYHAGFIYVRAWDIEVRSSAVSDQPRPA
jgi:hypothetical protein